MKTILKKIAYFIIFDLIFFLGGTATYFATPWGLKNYPMQYHWNVFFVLSADTSGHDSGTGKSILFGFVLPAIVVFTVVKVLYFLLKRTFLEKKLIKIPEKNWNIVKFLYFTGSILFLTLETKAWKYFEIARIISGPAVLSDFYEQNCITDFTVTEPEIKRNIIYIFMESMESDFTDIENGGVFEKSLIPELTKLANEHISFSENNFPGGGTNLQGTSWTVAGLLSKLTSLPYFLPFSRINNTEVCLKNVTGLNDVLHNQGYNQVFAMGSEKQFENRDTVLESHNVEIHDIKWYKENNFIPKEYHVFWGFEDLKLYEVSKIELTDLASKNKPFFYGMLTVDTHFPKGFKCAKCKNETKSQMDNVILCADRQLSEFINWIKAQPWYENTTIVITGDHNYLDAPFNNFIKRESKLSKKQIEEKRKFLNIIINPANEIPLKKQKNRKFSSFDITPTVLEAAGNKINGKGMYLGRSLLSENKTLCETYPADFIEKEIMKKTAEYEALK